MEQQELRSQSLPALFGRLGAEIALAQREMGSKLKNAAFGAAFFVVAALLGVFAIFALIVTVIAALALVMPFWEAALIVTVALLAIAVILALVGKARIAKAIPPVPERTIDSLKEDVQWVKTRVASTGKS